MTPGGSRVGGRFHLSCPTHTSDLWPLPLRSGGISLTCGILPSCRGWACDDLGVTGQGEGQEGLVEMLPGHSWDRTCVP